MLVKHINLIIPVSDSHILELIDGYRMAAHGQRGCGDCMHKALTQLQKLLRVRKGKSHPVSGTQTIYSLDHKKVQPCHKSV